MQAVGLEGHGAGGLGLFRPGCDHLGEQLGGLLELALPHLCIAQFVLEIGQQRILAELCQRRGNSLYGLRVVLLAGVCLCEPQRGGGGHRLLGRQRSQRCRRLGVVLGLQVCPRQVEPRLRREPGGLVLGQKGGQVLDRRLVLALREADKSQLVKGVLAVRAGVLLGGLVVKRQGGGQILAVTLALGQQESGVVGKRRFLAGGDQFLEDNGRLVVLLQLVAGNRGVKPDPHRMWRLGRLLDEGVAGLYHLLPLLLAILRLDKPDQAVLFLAGVRGVGRRPGEGFLGLRVFVQRQQANTPQVVHLGFVGCLGGRGQLAEQRSGGLQIAHVVQAQRQAVPGRRGLGVLRVLGQECLILSRRQLEQAPVVKGVGAVVHVQRRIRLLLGRRHYGNTQHHQDSHPGGQRSARTFHNGTSPVSRSLGSGHSSRECYANNRAKSKLLSRRSDHL